TGLPWTVVVRALLEQPHARAARERLAGVRLAGGRYFLLADGHDYYGIEHGATQAVVTQLGPRAAHLHTNHYFDPVLRRREVMIPGGGSHHRLNLATTLYAQQRPRDAEALWSLLHARQDAPGSLSVDPPPRGDPSASATCATMIMRLHEGWIRVVRGAAHRNPPLELRIDRFEGGPPPA
ncbi:MAG: hypothetical protein KDK70_40895, partial [Myxococcales bacterium]|nr:hypothetical protein [Myxococcales bacterium]